MGIHEIKKPTGSGKTTEALEKLAKAGGGIFITQDTNALKSIINRLNLTDVNIDILQVKEGTTIVIDDSEAFDITLVKATRKA